MHNGHRVPRHIQRTFNFVPHPLTPPPAPTMSTSAPAEPNLRYPIGKLVRKPQLTAEERRSAIDAIADAPRALRAAVANLTDAQLDTPYRAEGWTVRQVVHHLADSHLNAYSRFRLALTEDNPTIEPYDEAKWAELEDALTMPVGVSIDLLERMHARLGTLLRSLHESDFQRTMNHTQNGPMTVDALLGMYSWHGRHHIAHVTALRNRMQWS